MPAPAGKHFYTEEEKNLFRTDPEKFLEYRKKVGGVMQERFPIFLRSHQPREATIPIITELVKARVGPDGEFLVKIFTPSFSLACRRPTPGEDFLEALTQDHTRVVSGEISRFTETGIQMKDGKHLEFDLIVTCGKTRLNNRMFTSAQGSILIIHEIQAEYALQCAAKISLENLHSLVPKQEVTTQWRRHVDD
ncbi:hypothetical protein DTO164E3_3439 [Paecilomyces variotii]|nr:hypothetical protein DTO164E3_3439 [Paecilomyces variotii]KAJ9279766.1 hypothetical protein DTO021D3_3271 [Paecilomyces variotii]KAJ9285774.1 hypothetical protein DTO021C3_6616 [Paecilomyces variotii]KAJ9382015.1 hypothetical protein DTO032I4_5821 [Paecilomyces variotii]